MAIALKPSFAAETLANDLLDVIAKREASVCRGKCRWLSKEGEDKPDHEMIHIGAALGRIPIGIVFEKLHISRLRRLVARMSKELFRTCLTVVMPASGWKKPKCFGKSAKEQATVLLASISSVQNS